jgi:hypothetical protein
MPSLSSVDDGASMVAEGLPGRLLATSTAMPTGALFLPTLLPVSLLH